MGIALMGNGSVVCPFAVGMWCFYDGTEDLSTIYPGTKWQKMEGRFLFGSNSSHTVGMTGGEENHKLTISEMPSHDHMQRKVVSNNMGALVVNPHIEGMFTGDELGIGQTSWFENKAPLTTSVSGGDQPHNNMPPYYVTNMWKRTA